MSKPRQWMLGGSTLVALAALVGLSTLTSRANAGVRDVVLVARGMAFYLEGHQAPNPTLTVRPGERVRVTLRNDAAGFVHDLAAPAVGLDIPLLRTGETMTVEFQAPRAGRYDYVCRPHAQMMRGVIEVAGR